MWGPFSAAVPPVFGTSYLEFGWFVPNNGTAVLKESRGITERSFYVSRTPRVALIYEYTCQVLRGAIVNRTKYFS